jgi:adenylosuccinate synthase
MKGDVLSGFESLQVCTHYNYRGDKIDFMPYDIVHEDVTPVYDQLDGWNRNLTGIQAEKDFPLQLSEYIAYIEDNTKVPVSIVSVGPDRTQTIERKMVLAF